MCERSGETLGTLRIDLSELLLQPDMSLLNREYNLRPPPKKARIYRLDGGKQPCIFLSVCFRSAENCLLQSVALTVFLM